MKTYIEFKKQRELGDILSNTFNFIRNEFKPFTKLVLQVSGPYLLFFLIAITFYIYSTGDLLDFNTISSGSMPDFFTFFMAGLALIISGILAYVSANSAALHYIKSYVNNKGQINTEDIKQDVRQSFMSFLGLGILKWITLIFAVLLCVLPVFYLMVPMAIVFCVFVFENKSISDAYGYSFSLVNSEFWITLATVIVIGIIVMVAGYAFSIPSAIYSMVKMGLFSGEMDPSNMNTFTDPIYIALNVLNYLFNFLLNLITIVGSAFIYFNLNERKHFTGTLDTINTLGNTQD